MTITQRLKKQRSFIFTFIGVMAVLVAVPQFTSRAFTMNVLILFCIWAIMGLGWNFIGGYAGQVSNGHALFFAIGAYVGALSLKWYGLTPWISMWIGVVIAGAVAYLIGLPLLRLRGHYFAIATMALAECALIIFKNWDWIGGSTGVSFSMRRMSPWLSLQFRGKHEFFYICLAFLALFIILTRIMEGSKFGYYCRAIKANQESAESSGVDAARYKRWAYVISAGIVSIGGALYAQFFQYVDPVALMPLANSMLIVLVCVMGGIGTVWGPVMGAFVMITINEYSRGFLGRISGLNLVIYGILVILIVQYLPNGLISLLKRTPKPPKLKGSMRIVNNE